jgi:hypothetical protein
LSFTNLSPFVVLTGLAGLAGVLFLLQRLRVRHRELQVVTTLFWKQAVQETRARVFVQRFRHPWAFLLVLLIASLLWLGLAGVRLAPDGRREVVFLLDTSAGMAWGDRFEQATRALMREAARVPGDQLRVIACGGGARTLMLPGESTLLLHERLRDLRPQPSPAGIEAELRGLSPRADLEVRVLIFGDAPVSAESLALLDESISVRRVRLEAEAPRASNRAVTALGVSTAASGAWSCVDVLCELSGAVDETTPLTVTLDGAPAVLEAERSFQSGRVRILLRDVPASGQVLRVALQRDDGFETDDAAAIALPDRPMIRVALSPSLDGVLRPLLEADPAILLVQAEPRVVVRRAGESLGDGQPALEFVSPNDQEEAFLVRHGPEDDSHRLLARAGEELGLNEIDAMDLARVAERPIAVGVLAEAGRGVGVWDVLLGEEFNFVQSSSFPLFVARALRWLAADEGFTPWSAAGVATGDSTPRTGAGDVWLDPVGAAFTPPQAGRYRAADGTLLAASLLDPSSSLPGWQAGLEATDQALESARGWSALTWIVLLALVLLAIEWALFRRGRIP